MGDVEKYCQAFDEWAQLIGESEDFGRAWRVVRGRIRKSCLLSRTVYSGERPSKTPCPVHEGKWSGCHLGWPGQKWSDGTPVEESPMLRKWYDAGCRCYKHSCGCTAGWQPDEHCGCGVQP